MSLPPCCVLDGTQVSFIQFRVRKDASNNKGRAGKSLGSPHPGSQAPHPNSQAHTDTHLCFEAGYAFPPAEPAPGPQSPDIITFLVTADLRPGGDSEGEMTTQLA